MYLLHSITEENRDPFLAISNTMNALYVHISDGPSIRYHVNKWLEEDYGFHINMHRKTTNEVLLKSTDLEEVIQAAEMYKLLLSEGKEN